MSKLPACTATDVIRALKRAGFTLDYTSGSHQNTAPGSNRNDLPHEVKLTPFTENRRISSSAARALFERELAYFDRAFAQPVERSDSSADYVPTQINGGTLQSAWIRWDSLSKLGGAGA